jgi:ABC-type uncharacterized transport system permease subunit
MSYSLRQVGDRYASLAGWAVREILFLYSQFSMLSWHIKELQLYNTQGTFDMPLERPIPQPQFAGREINDTGFADELVGIAGMLIVLKNLKIRWRC